MNSGMVTKIKMEKLPMCRICLVKDVRMYVVANKNLHELYEKLTDVPFVTEDSRPMLACFFCCTKLKQCWRFQRKCLEAEELFSQMMNEDYEQDPLKSKGQLSLYNGFVKTPVENINIVGACQTDSDAFKKELPDVSENLYDIIDPREEHRIKTYGSELDNVDNSCPDVEATPTLHTESDSDDAPLLKIKSEVKVEPESLESELDNVDNSCPGVQATPTLHDESDTDDAPLLEIKSEVEAELEPIGASVAKKPKLDTRRSTIGDTIPVEIIVTPKIAKRNDNYPKLLRVMKIEDKTQNHTNNHGVHKSSNNDTTLGTSSRNNTSKSKTSNKDIASDDISGFQKGVKDERFKCSMCQRGFSLKYRLTRHMLTHSDEKPFKCDICHRGFKTKCDMTYHFHTHTDEKRFKCDICQGSFKTRSNLINHIRSHNDEKSFKCDMCPCSFKRKDYLTSHLSIHLDEKAFRCNICEKGFKKKHHLTIHMRVHNGEKPFKCDVCQRSFSQKINLTIHKRTHTGEKPFKCDICHRSFRQKINLTLHNRTHTGEKPFKCDICQRSYRTKGELKKHTCKKTLSMEISTKVEAV